MRSTLAADMSALGMPHTESIHDVSGVFKGNVFMLINAAVHGSSDECTSPGQFPGKDAGGDPSTHVWGPVSIMVQLGGSPSRHLVVHSLPVSHGTCLLSICRTTILLSGHFPTDLMIQPSEVGVCGAGVC